MNKPTIIPTPSFVKYGGEIPISGRDGTVKVAMGQRPGTKEKIALEVLTKAVAKLGGRVLKVATKRSANIYLSLLEKEAHLAAKLTKADLATFKKPSGQEQGYVIKPERGSRAYIRLVAQEPQGLLYAVVSLTQLLRAEGKRIVAAGAHVRDWPSFRYRGNDWLLWCECGRWAYDRGDGPAAYVQRIERKLDFSLQNKINVISFDGFGWNKQRFPGYGAMMRRLAQYSRNRGIKLVFGGYGAGYGAGALYDGTIFRNRRNYPNGKLYGCYHLTGRPKSATYGGCLSNAALIKLKQKELREFVRAVEPGALYIHNHDCDAIGLLADGWKARCPQCRQRWPNDAIDAPDGAAGAFAQHYDALSEAIFSVKNKHSGYNAARDCTAIMISPGYTAYYESDEDWDLAVRYWTMVSRQMKHVNNVQFAFREQLLRHDGKGKRFAEMRSSLDTDGNGHGFCNLVFTGADGYINDHLFHAMPVISKVYEGAELLLDSTGHAYQEPLQMLNAEYAWRSEGSAWFDDPLPQDYPAMFKQFSEYRDGLRRPAAIIGKNGFLEEACRRLYGTDAGPHMAEVNRMMSDRGDVPIPYLHNAAFHYWVPQWACDEAAGLIRQWRTRWWEIADMTEAAANETRLAHNLAAPDDPIREDLAWMAETFLLGREAAEIFAGYCDIYVDAQERVGGDTAIRFQDIEQAANELLARLDGLEVNMKNNFSTDMLDHLGADTGYWPTFLAFARERVNQVVDGVRTGKRGSPTTGMWW